MIRQPKSKAMFLTSWPNGQLKPVEIIEQRKDITYGGKYYYIRYQNGGTDTTEERFLFDVPSELSFRGKEE